MDWLIDWLIDWFIDLLIDLLIDWCLGAAQAGDNDVVTECVDALFILHESGQANHASAYAVSFYNLISSYSFCWFLQN